MRQILFSERKKSPEMEKDKLALPEGNDLTVDNSGLKESKQVNMLHFSGGMLSAEHFGTR